MQASLVLDIIQRGRPCPHVFPASAMMQCGCSSTVHRSTRTHQGTLHEGSSANCRAVVHCQTHWRLISVLDGRDRIRWHTSRSLSAHLMFPSAWPCHVMLPEVSSMVPAPHDSPLNGIKCVGRDASPKARRPQAHEALASCFCRLVREKVCPAGTDEGPVTGPTLAARQGKLPLIGM